MDSLGNMTNENSITSADTTITPHTESETKLADGTSSKTETKRTNSADLHTLDVQDLMRRNSSLLKDSDNEGKSSPRHGFIPGEAPAAATSTPLNITVDGGSMEQTTQEMQRPVVYSEETLNGILLELMENQVFNINTNGDPAPNFDYGGSEDDDDDDDIFRMINEMPFQLQEFRSGGQHIPEPLYPMGPLTYKECIVCMEKKDLNLRTCCAEAVCDDCVLMYVDIQIQQGNVKIGCPNDSCDKYVGRDEVMTRLTGEMKEKYNRFLVDANKDPNVKTCPRCSTITNVDPGQLKNPKFKKKGLRKTCTVCELDWCFPCQAPWHEGISCRMFKKGDKQLKSWAKSQQSGQTNAQKCPKCKIFIQRSSGCDHMTCTKCHVDFCYKCGERHIKIKFLGDHYSRLSIFGCKYRYLPNNPIRRKFVRGSIFAAKTIMLPVIAALAVGVGAIILGVGIFVFPVYGGIRLRNHLRQKKKRKEEKMYREMWRKKLHEIRITGDPYMENFNRMRELGHNPYSSFRTNVNGIGQGTLVVDELDMRRVTDMQLSTQDSVTSDDISLNSFNMDHHINRIQLSPANLDIHATLDTKMECNDEKLRGNKAECSSMSDISLDNNERVKGSRHSPERINSKGSRYSPEYVMKICDDQKVDNKNKSQTLHLKVCDSDDSESISQHESTEMGTLSDKSESQVKIVCSDEKTVVVMRKNEDNKLKKETNSSRDSKVKRLVSQYSCGLKSESSDDHENESESSEESESTESCPHKEVPTLTSTIPADSIKITNPSLSRHNATKSKKDRFSKDVTDNGKAPLSNNNATVQKEVPDMDSEELTDPLNSCCSEWGVKELVSPYGSTSVYV